MVRQKLAANAITEEATDIHKPEDTNEDDASAPVSFKLAERKPSKRNKQSVPIRRKRDAVERQTLSFMV